MMRKYTKNLNTLVMDRDLTKSHNKQPMKKTF